MILEIVALGSHSSFMVTTIPRHRHGGRVVSLNKLHHLFSGERLRRWPHARLYAPPSVAAEET
jgi:hypothetical protein